MHSQTKVLPFADKGGVEKLIKLIQEAPERPQAIQEIPHPGLRACCGAAATLYHAPGFRAEQHRLALMTLFIDAVQARLVLPHAKETQDNLAECHTLITEQHDYIHSLMHEMQTIEELVDQLKANMALDTDDMEKLKSKAVELEKDKESLKLQLAEAQNSASLAQQNREKEREDLNKSLDRIQAQVAKMQTTVEKIAPNS
jgi:DNA repair exonuclease SbcCD ATPase subunit